MQTQQSHVIHGYGNEKIFTLCIMQCTISRMMGQLLKKYVLCIEILYVIDTSLSTFFLASPPQQDSSRQDECVELFHAFIGPGDNDLLSPEL